MHNKKGIKIPKQAYLAVTGPSVKRMARSRRTPARKARRNGMRTTAMVRRTRRRTRTVRRASRRRIKNHWLDRLTIALNVKVKMKVIGDGAVAEVGNIFWLCVECACGGRQRDRTLMS